MKSRQLLVAAAATLSVAGLAFATIATKTFRTTALWHMFYQTTGTNSIDKIGYQPLAGHDLVNWALGTPLTTKRTNEVLALEITTDSSAASLVVWNKAASNAIATIATSTHIDRVLGQTTTRIAGPDHERFVAQMQFNANHNLLSGWLTVAGRLLLNPSNGTPAAVRIDTDRAYDFLVGDKAIANLDDIDRDARIAGEAHIIGVASAIFADGSTNTVLLPFGNLTIRHDLP